MDLKDKNILILGFSREGKSTLKFLKKHYPKNVVAVADKRKMKGVTYSGKNYLKHIKDFDVLIKSPGINSKDLKHPNITSQTEIFLQKHRNKTIAITGTKGKGITASLIYKILKKAGERVELIGNMGKPALDFYDKKGVFVFEVSSHQLEGLRISPHIAVFLNIYPDHLDFFKTFKKYFNAKKNIYLHQDKKDYLIYNRKIGKVKTKAKKIPFSRKQVKNTPFKGKAFLENINAGIEVAKLLKIKNYEQVIKKYKPFEHRLEIVGTFKGIKFINDSAATIPQATIASINNFKNVDTLILGGSDKKSDYKELGKEITKSKIKTLILFPVTGERIAKQVKKDINIVKVKNMKQAVTACYKYSEKLCLLSPASASFSVFKDYQDRGEQFKKYVKKQA